MERRAMPLRGLSVVVTRPAHQGAPLGAALRRRGARVSFVPLLAVAPVPVPRDTWDAVLAQEWLVFTSANGVAFGWDAAPSAVRRAWQAHDRVACVGPGTADAARARGVRVTAVATEHMAESLADLLDAAEAGSVAWVRGADARDVLRTRLARRRTTLCEAVAYRAESIEPDRAGRRALRDGDILTLTSPSAARRLATLDVGDTGRLACIGPVTARAAREAGLAVHAVARPCTVQGLTSAVVSLATRT